MADYIYLLQTRLSGAQQTALQHVRDAAKSRAITVFLVGGAVRDLSTGSPIRDLDFAVQGNATKLKKDLQKVGGVLIGEDDATQSLFFNFPGGVRVEVGATLSASFPKPGKPVYKPATILDDLRRRDFTANAMAISLNEGSYGLLMDPLNGIADLENRELRLVSNYGFIEDPSRLIRAARLMARLGWSLEAKTQQRYETAKAEDYIAALHPFHKAYELEEIFHEEDPLRVLRRLESEGWAKFLSPVLTAAKANEAELERLHDTVGQLDSMGIHPDPSAAYFPLLTAKLAPKDVAALKASFVRPGFAAQIDALDAETKAFAALFTAKDAAAPSAAWKLLFSHAPEPILWLAHTTKSAPIKARFDAFFSDWSQARTKIPYQLMQEMRIVPELPIYQNLLEDLFFAIMDGKLDTVEASKAYLEPFSPPAPPPPVNLRRRAVKREAKPAKSRSKKAVAAPVDDADLDEVLPDLPEADDAETETDPAPPAPKPPAPKPAPAKPVPAKSAPAKAPAKPEAPKPAVKQVPAKPVPAKPAAKAPVKAAAKVPVKIAAKAAAKPAAKAPAKAVKPPVKAAAKPAPKAPAKKAATPAPKKAAAKVPPKPAAKKAPVKPVPAKSAKPAPKKLASKPAPKAPAKKPAKPAPKPAKKSAPKPKSKR
jgi:tRNA nucleotidyltransferase/poly(A) polymerase